MFFREERAIHTEQPTKLKVSKKISVLVIKRPLIEYSPIIELVERIETDNVCSADCKQ